MRNEYTRSRTSHISIPWRWIGIIAGIIFLIFIIRSFFSGDTGTENPSQSTNPLEIRGLTESSIVMIDGEQIEKNKTEKVYNKNVKITTGTGSAQIKNNHATLILDELSEIRLKESTDSGEVFTFAKGRAWITGGAPGSKIEMKNLSFEIPGGNIILIEQTNNIYSTVYAIKGGIEIATSIGKSVLKDGQKIMISASDLANPNFDFNSQTADIDEGIADIELFIENGGKEILENKKHISLSGSTTKTGSVNPTGTGSINPLKIIELIDPKDGSMIQKTPFNIQGNLLSKEIKRITFNNKEAVISPVNETFAINGMTLSDEVNDIVYKVYGANGNQLERGVITLYASKQALQSEKLIPNTSPVSSNDFKITTPIGNPFTTTERSVRVQGIAPKNRVSYILVNDYKLQKFVPQSTNWYYFANMDAGTLKDGFNLYTIKFYGADDTLIYTQLFTIIKESKNAVLSGEASR